MAPPVGSGMFTAQLLFGGPVWFIWSLRQLFHQRQSEESRFNISARLWVYTSLLGAVACIGFGIWLAVEYELSLSMAFAILGASPAVPVAQTREHPEISGEEPVGRVPSEAAECL